MEKYLQIVSSNPIQDVAAEYTELSWNGIYGCGKCPICGGAHFIVNSESQIFYCFDCASGGDVATLVTRVKKISSEDAVDELGERCGIGPVHISREHREEKHRLVALCNAAADYFHQQLYTDAGADCLAYARARGLTDETIAEFRLGYAPNEWHSLRDYLKSEGYTDAELVAVNLCATSANGSVYDRFRNRFMFPIVNQDGCVGFGGRVMDDSSPKYLNTSDTRIFSKTQNLFAFEAAASDPNDFILVEGFMDAVALHQHGFCGAIASLGTALTTEQARKIGVYANKVFLIYDGDEAGVAATERAVPMLQEVGLDVRIVRLQEAKDPDEFLRNFGADAFRKCLENAISANEYRIWLLSKDVDMKDPMQLAEFLFAAKRLFHGNEVNNAEIIDILSRYTGVPVPSLMRIYRSAH